jgi:hypothetical protein
VGNKELQSLAGLRLSVLGSYLIIPHIYQVFRAEIQFLMKFILVLVMLMLAAGGGSAASARNLGDFALLDHMGAFHRLSSYADKRAVVLYVYGAESDVAKNAVRKLNILREKYVDRDIAFLMIDPIAGESRDQVSRALAGENNQIPVLMDSAQLVSYSLGVISTGEVLVIQPRRMALLYRGALDSRAGVRGGVRSGEEARNYLDEVLSAISLSGEVIPNVPWEEGDSIRYDAISESGISYVNDVVPILERRCSSCHREGGVAPWAMDSHQMVSGWSPMMRETLLTMRMPPAQIDNVFVDKFVDLHFITDAEKAVLVKWIDAGSPVDGEIDPLALERAQKSDWVLGEPDLIVEFPPQEIPASGVLEYKFVPVEIGLDQDRWVRAYEFDIGDKAALHHVVAYTQDERQQRQNPSGGGSRTNFGGYAPGREYVSFEADTGILLEQNMRFMVQFHYTTIGRKLTDVTRIGLYFHETPPKYPLSRTAVMDGEFVIPPGVADYRVTARANISNDSYLYNIAPHMHYRGKWLKYRVEYPDGSAENLLSIPNFQHNWQMIYKLKEPMFLPAGSVIVAEGSYDNSERNPLNPDPTQEVRWGEQVWDEMFIAWMRVSEARRAAR